MINDNNKSFFKTEYLNFVSITSKNIDWTKQINNMLNNSLLIDCNRVVEVANGGDVFEKTMVIGNGFQFLGDTLSQNTQPNPEDKISSNANAQKMANYARKLSQTNNKGSELADYAKTHAFDKSQGRCAKYVRLALQGSGVITPSVWPNSACAYYRFLESWGFVKVFDGMRGEESAQGYEPIVGDISVIAGLTTDKIHGHIQIYHNDGKWYSDFGARNKDCYSSPRPFKIYRLPDNNA